MASTIGQITAVNPATEEVIASFDAFGPDEVEMALADAQDAFLEWRERPIAERAVPMRALAALLRERSERYARLATLEMGKPILEAKAEIEKCAFGSDHFAQNAARYLADEEIRANARRSIVAFQPLGVVLAVMPWNFPLWQVYRFAAPALMAGNTGVLKHASNVSGCALAIEEIFAQAGFPAGAFRTLLIGNPQVRAVIEHPLVRAVTLTGSTPAGKAVAAQAGAVLKKTVLELGGSDPYLVLEDADLDQAAPICARSRLINGGQSCIAAKRFIVVEPTLAGFTERFVSFMKAQKVGDPLVPGTDVGPLARHDLRDELHRQVVASVERGARVLLGGEVPEGRGAFYPPTVLTDVRPGMPAYDDELFGPVAAIIRAKDEQDAIRIANDSPFGLGAAVFTRDPDRGERVARALEAGSTFINGPVVSDPRLPFGGIKESGYGRELGSYGIKEFVNAKTVYVSTSR